MSRITKSVTFNDVTDAELLAWIQHQMQAEARPGERPDFSRFVRGILYRAFDGDNRHPAPIAPLPDTLLADIRAVVEAAVAEALHNANITSLPVISADDDSDDFSGLLLE